MTPIGERSFSEAVAVVTGSGTGMGRQLVLQLVAAGARVAMCDVSSDSMDETASLCASPSRVMPFVADVADAASMDAFASHVRDRMQTDQVNLLFNNADIGGAASFVVDPQSAWEKTFNVCWGGVYNGCRSFLPMLMAAPWGHVVNTSSVNGFWAALGAERPNTAYSAAKFAVKGFTESLITDFRVNAPHLRASVVMPGHIGTSIIENSMTAHAPGVGGSIRAAVESQSKVFREDAPMSAADAATAILSAVQRGEWRIVVGEDAVTVDERVRADPAAAYDPAFCEQLVSDGIFLFAR
jgi:NAD(P)-dependent dehydrogenase (short-subunit alcohol dehydrogenase family)